MLKQSVMISLGVFVLSSNALATQGAPTFTSSEHMSAGDAVFLKYEKEVPAKHGEVLHLPNGVTLTYGEILSLGDFYGIPGEPVVEGEGETGKASRFIVGFESFARSIPAIKELDELLQVIHEEKTAVETGMSHGEKPYDVFYRIGDDNARRFNCITGGECGSDWWLKPGRYLALTKRNFDHFGEDALIAYHVGHQVAIDEAIQAGIKKDPSQLELAYAMNAYACHFLSDQFSAGHIRTPRRYLQDHTTPGLVGSILAAYMHYEEGPHGLHVANARGDTWMAYGDAYYFAQENAQNRVMLAEALQASADEIFAAYDTKAVPEDKVSRLVPHAEQVGSEVKQDIAPLFYWSANNHKVYRRDDTTNLFDYEWKTNWWGWSTLIKLNKERGMPTHAQGLLASSPYAKKALSLGLITDKKMVSHVRSLK